MGPNHRCLDFPPKKNRFWLAPFSIHAARGVIRDRSMRRRTMFFTLITALVLLGVGSTFLQPILREHPAWFLLFWCACTWLTLSAVLLALFDLLMMRAQTRKQKEVLRTGLASDLPDAHDER